jgi:hypothetical protein
MIVIYYIIKIIDCVDFTFKITSGSLRYHIIDKPWKELNKTGDARCNSKHTVVAACNYTRCHPASTPNSSSSPDSSSNTAARKSTPGSAIPPSSVATPTPVPPVEFGDAAGVVRPMDEIASEPIVDKLADGGMAGRCRLGLWRRRRASCKRATLLKSTAKASGAWRDRGVADEEAGVGEDVLVWACEFNLSALLKLDEELVRDGLATGVGIE